MAAQTQSFGMKKIPRRRRKRHFGLSPSILSDATAYLNPCTESSSHLSAEEAAMFDAVIKSFNDSES